MTTRRAFLERLGLALGIGVTMKATVPSATVNAIYRERVIVGGDEIFPPLSFGRSPFVPIRPGLVRVATGPRLEFNGRGHDLGKWGRDYQGGLRREVHVDSLGYRWERYR